MENIYRLQHIACPYKYKSPKIIDLMPLYGDFVLAMQGEVGIIAFQNAGWGRLMSDFPRFFAGDGTGTGNNPEKKEAHA